YLPLAVWLPILAIRHRGAFVWTAANPGISHGGGVVGESKASILSLLDHPRLLPWVEIPAGPPASERARDAASRMTFGFPAIVKPDSGQRGFAVRRVSSVEDLERYLTTMTNAALVQKYHPGPDEVGIMWIRGVGIFSITKKVLPVLEGDGRHTIEALLFRDRRRLVQAHVFLERLGARAFERPSGAVALGDAANHVQGARFHDGAELVEMFAPLIDEVMRDRDSLDIGRFDVRYRTIDDAGIIEFNGTTSESTNIYDAEKHVIWAWGVLLRHWSHLYRLGAERRAQGVQPMTARTVWRTWRTFKAARTGSSRSS
ncbi:MAG: hypothetical protein KDA28_03135, partial [Phycisphaerales bacterium]|nr:hypothetical protein [Phycisphaerales bacterium]